MIHCLFSCQTQNHSSHSYTKHLFDNIIINDEYIDLPNQSKLSFSYFSLHSVKTVNISHHNLDLTHTIQGIRSFPSLKISNNISTTTPKSQHSLNKGIRSTKTTMGVRKNKTLSKIKKYLKDNSF